MHNEDQSQHEDSQNDHFFGFILPALDRLNIYFLESAALEHTHREERPGTVTKARLFLRWLIRY